MMLEILKKYKKWIYAVILILVAALSVWVLSSTIKANKVLSYVYSIQNHNDKTKDSVDYLELSKDVVIVQEFQSKSSFDGFSLCFHSTNDELAGSTNIQLIEADTNTIIYEDTELNSNLGLDKLCNYYLDSANKGKEDTRYILKITSDTVDRNNQISIYTQETGFYNGKLMVDGQGIQERNLGIGTFRYTHRLESIFNKLLKLSVMVFMVICIFYVIFRKRLELVIGIAVLGFGCMYILMFPPGSTHDAEYHYFMVYQYSNNMLGVEDCNNDDGSKNLAMRFDDYYVFKKCMEHNDDYYGNPTANLYLDEMESFSIFIQNDNMVDSNHMVPAVGVVPYLPYVIGMSFARIINLGAIPTMYMSELFSLIFCTVMIMWSIRIAPLGKEVLAMVALLPVTIEQFICFSYDGPTIAVSFVFIAYWLRFLYQKPEDRENKSIRLANKTINLSWDTLNIMYMLEILMIIATCKGGVYTLLGVLLLPILNKNISTKWKIIMVAIVLGVMCLFYMPRYMGVLNTTFSSVAGSHNNGTDVYTYGYAVQHPIKFILMTIGAFVENPGYYFGSAFGAYLGRNTLMIPITIIIPFFVMIVGAAVKDEENSYTLGLNYRVIILAIFILFTLLMAFLMLYMTPIGWNIIGLDGRYFLPLLPLAFLALRNNKITISKHFKSRMLLGFCYWHLVAVFYILWYAFGR